MDMTMTDAPQPATRSSAAFSDYVAASAVTLHSIEVTGDRSDLQAFDDVVHDARVVSLGEATHGTRDFFQIKHRFLEWLVLDHGFTTFALEGSYPDALALNEFVMGSDHIDPYDAVAEMRFWTWNTQEVVDLAVWLREYNARPSTRRKVSFHGYDIQGPTSAVHVVLRHLAHAAPDRREAVAHDLAPLANEVNRLVASHHPEMTAALPSVVADLLEEFDDRRRSWSARTGEPAHDRARLALRTLQQSFEMRDPDRELHGRGYRDLAMAENIGHLLELDGPDARLVSWAHNAHVQHADYDGTVTMGGWLDRWHGPRHVVVGFAFDRGGFQAIDHETKSLRDFDVPASRPGSLGEALTEAGAGDHVLDLSGIPQDGAARQWLATAPASRFIGALYSDDEDLLVADYHEEGLEPGYQLADPTTLFDLLVFVERTQAARRNHARAMTAGSTAASTESSPSNLDFRREAETGDVAAWNLMLGGIPYPFSCEAEDGRLRLERHAPWAWGDATASQRFRLASAGRLTLRCRVSADMPDPGGGARVVLWALKDEVPVGMEASDPVSGGQHNVELTIDMPDGADVARVLLAASGNGWAEFSHLDVRQEDA